MNWPDALNSLPTTLRGEIAAYQLIDRLAFNYHLITNVFSALFRYGNPHPNFFQGTLEEATNEACHKPAKDVSAWSLLFMNQSLPNPFRLSAQTIGYLSTSRWQRADKCVL